MTDRILELLADLATDGLSDIERRELDQLLLDHPDVDRDVIDLAAASIASAVEIDEPLPPALAEHIAAEGERFVERKTSGPSFKMVQWSGWLVAAAAILIAAIAWWPVASPDTPAQRRAVLVERGSTQVDLQALDHPRARGVTGDVVWNDALQEGYLRVTGLETNDPGVSQYQFWIFDEHLENADQPIDGGVFDVVHPDSRTGEIIIPIDAKLKVQKAVAFAVTIERPGGVVVSARQDLILFAPVSPG